VTVGKYRVIATGVDDEVTLEMDFDNERDAQAFAKDVKAGWCGVDFPEDRAHVYVAKEVTL
jgi:hypothetical protein